LKAEINLLKNPRFLKGSFSKTASGLLTFEIFNALPNIIEELLKDLKSKFKIIYSDNSNIFTVNNYKFNSNWDIWAGFYIDSQSSDGDSLLYEIGNFINTILNENRFNKYKQYW
jgi:hypothetical protein